MPTVVGLPEATAVASIAQANLVAESTTEASDTVPQGEVISQTPEDGTQVDEGRTVRITVSAGPSAITVPDLRGRTVAEARAQLTDLGLELGEVEEVDDPETPKDQIIDSNPTSGTGGAGSKVNVRVGTGEVAVPNVVGRSQSDAQRLLADANLQVETEFQQTNSVAEGQVISQDPKDGTLEIGGTVKIVVAQKEPPVVRRRRDPDADSTETRATRVPDGQPEPLSGSSSSRLLDARDAGARPGSSAGSAGRDHAGHARGVVHERAEPGRARRHPACRTSRASWPACGAHRG